MQSIRKHPVLFIFGFLTLCSIIFATLFTNMPRYEDNYVTLKEGWEISINDTSYSNSSINELLFPVLNKGDVLQMSHTLSADATIPTPVLLMYTIHSDIVVSYNGEHLYEYGSQLYDEGKLIGYGYHFIHLPDNYSGAKLDITMRISEDDAFSRIQAPQICNSASVYRDFIIRNRVPLAVNLFLCVFGFLLLLLSVIFFLYNPKFLRLLCIGGFSLGIGCWSLCNYDLVTFFSYDLRAKAFVEFGALYAAPLFVLLYFWKDDFVTRNRMVEGCYTALLTTQALFTASSYILQLTNTVHFPKLLRLQHLLLLLLCLSFISLTLHDILRHQLKNKTLALGMASLIVIGLSDMIKYSVSKYTVAGGDANFTSSLCVGALLFVLAQLIDFYAEITDIFLKGAKAQMLEQIAFTDALTGIANRRQCEILWDELDKNPRNYGIFSFDLNNLKVTNDTKGHPAGDFLLKTFATVLSNVFSSYGTVGRFGGDEFIVFLPELDGIDVDALTSQLEQEISLVNEKHPDLHLSTAYGFCRHTDYPSYSARVIYRLADEEMYRHKISMKTTK